MWSHHPYSHHLIGAPKQELNRSGASHTFVLEYHQDDKTAGDKIRHVIFVIYCFETVGMVNSQIVLDACGERSAHCASNGVRLKNIGELIPMSRLFMCQNEAVFTFIRRQSRPGAWVLHSMMKTVDIGQSRISKRSVVSNFLRILEPRHDIRKQRIKFAGKLRGAKLGRPKI